MPIILAISELFQIFLKIIFTFPSPRNWSSLIVGPTDPTTVGFLLQSSVVTFDKSRPKVLQNLEGSEGVVVV